MIHEAIVSSAVCYGCKSQGSTKIATQLKHSDKENTWTQER
jgi:hypothetical protein